MAIAEMAAKGQAKLQRKSGQMATSYAASKGRATQNYAAAGFGPTRTQAYNAGVQSAQYKAPDPAKWARNWAAKMAE